MAQIKLPIIRASLRYNKLTDPEFLTRLNAVLSGTFSNPRFTTPPVDAATFKAGIDGFAATITDASDGSKKAIAARVKKRQEMSVMMRHLGVYVEVASNGDMDTFLSSGFEPAATARSAPQPLAQPAIGRIDQGITGQLLVNVTPVKGARQYEVRYAPVSAGGTPGTWIVITLPSAKQATALNGLSAGTLYTFQVRGYGKLGYTEWSDALNRMCF